MDLIEYDLTLDAILELARLATLDSLLAWIAMLFLFRYEINEQIPQLTMTIITIVPDPIATSFALTSKSPIVKSLWSYHGPAGTTSPFQSTLIVLSLGATTSLFLSASIAAFDAASAPAVFGLQ